MFHKTGYVVLIIAGLALLAPLVAFQTSRAAQPPDQTVDPIPLQAGDGPDPSASIASAASASTYSLIGRVQNPEYREVDTQGGSPLQYVVFRVDIERLIGPPQVSSPRSLQLWIGGLRGPSGPVFVSHGPEPVMGQRAVLFLRHEPYLGPDAHIPAAGPWSYLPIRDDSSVMMPTGVPFDLDQVINMITQENMP